MFGIFKKKRQKSREGLPVLHFEEFCERFEKFSEMPPEEIMQSFVNGSEVLWWLKKIEQPVVGLRKLLLRNGVTLVETVGPKAAVYKIEGTSIKFSVGSKEFYAVSFDHREKPSKYDPFLRDLCKVATSTEIRLIKYHFRKAHTERLQQADLETRKGLTNIVEEYLECQH